MIKLQKPPYVYMNGRLTAWDDARIHVASEALIRGISVFEGIKGYWSHDGRAFRLLALREHYERLRRSARLQHLPFEMDFDGFAEACRGLDIPFERRLMDRTELASADAICLAGTLMELGRVRHIEARALPDSDPLFDRIADEFWACVRGERANPGVALTEV